jgi:hypothetical protein
MAVYCHLFLGNPYFSIFTPQWPAISPRLWLWLWLWLYKKKKEKRNFAQRLTIQFSHAPWVCEHTSAWYSPSLFKSALTINCTTTGAATTVIRINTTVARNVMSITITGRLGGLDTSHSSSSSDRIMTGHSHSAASLLQEDGPVDPSPLQYS